jgi:hypothetical protein
MQSGMGCDGAGVERNGVLRYKGVFFFLKYAHSVSLY